MAGWGEALSYLGKTAPGIGESFDAAAAKKRQDEIDRVKTMAALAQLASENAVRAQKMKEDQYKQGELERTTGEAVKAQGEAKSAFGKYTTDLSAAKKRSELPKTITETKVGGLPGETEEIPNPELMDFNPDGTAPENLVERNSYLEKIGGMSPVEQINEFKLPYHAAADAGVKNTVEQVNKEETNRIAEDRAKKIGGIGASSMAGSNDPKFIQKAIGMVDDYESVGKITAAAASVLRARATVKPAGVLEDLTAFEKPSIQQNLSLPIETVSAEQKAAATRRGASRGESESNLNSLSGFKPIAGVKITDESVQKIKTVAPETELMKGLVDDIIKKFDEKGNRFTGDDAADYASKVRNLQLIAKGTAAYNLGVLAGPDLMLLEQTIPNPSDIKSGMSQAVLGSMKVRLQNFRNTIDKKSNLFYTANGFERVKKNPAGETKVINGVTYTKVGGGWQRK